MKTLTLNKPIFPRRFLLQLIQKTNRGKLIIVFNFFDSITPFYTVILHAIY